jgi:hypothetical protein
MSKNSNLHKAKKEKNDEFYTQLCDIEKELVHYKEHFKDKIIFCNCDNPEWSNFWKYFMLNFKHLGLKKLISTHYEKENTSYKLEFDGINTVKTNLQQNGDFRSAECIEILKESDIVVTNPPFSLFREYVAQLMEYEKKFLIIGSLNSTTCKDIFYLLKENKIWLGHKNVKEFRTANGEIQKFGNIGWYTNLDITKQHSKLILTETYKDNENNYPKYDNYDAINVNKLALIPNDYKGEIGVPISILEHICFDQFEIIGKSDSLAKPITINNKLHKNPGRFYLDGKKLYDRIVIRRIDL